MSVGGVTVRPVRPADEGAWLRMRHALWPGAAPGEHERGMAAWLRRDDCVALVAVDGGGLACGFAELSTRPYADGCETSPVAYLEGWYVDERARGCGVGAALLAAGEAWARSRGLAELASDALLDNDLSQRAHLACGFEEVDRVVQYRKPLTSAPSDGGAATS